MRSQVNYFVKLTDPRKDHLLALPKELQRDILRYIQTKNPEGSLKGIDISSIDTELVIRQNLKIADLKQEDGLVYKGLDYKMVRDLTNHSKDKLAVRLQRLIDRYNDIETLLNLCHSADYAAIAEFLEHNTDIINEKFDGFTALYVACCCDKKDVVELLLKSGANPAIPSDTYFIEDPAVSASLTPLYITASKGFVDIAKLLIKYKVNVNQTIYSESRYSNSSPLLIATQNGHLKMVDFLLQNNAKIINRADGVNAFEIARIQLGKDSFSQEMIQRYGAISNLLIQRTPFLSTVLTSKFDEEESASHLTEYCSSVDFRTFKEDVTYDSVPLALTTARFLREESLLFLSLYPSSGEDPSTAEILSTDILRFHYNPFSKAYFILMNDEESSIEANSHFMLLTIDKETQTITYFDPATSEQKPLHKMPRAIAEAIMDLYGKYDLQSIVTSKTSMQSCRYDESLERHVLDNHHCGAFVFFVAASIEWGLGKFVDGNFMVLNRDEKWVKFPDLDQNLSKKFGNDIRDLMQLFNPLASDRSLDKEDKIKELINSTLQKVAVANLDIDHSSFEIAAERVEAVAIVSPSSEGQAGAGSSTDDVALEDENIHQKWLESFCNLVEKEKTQKVDYQEFIALFSTIESFNISQSTFLIDRIRSIIRSDPELKYRDALNLLINNKIIETLIDKIQHHLEHPESSFKSEIDELDEYDKRDIIYKAELRINKLKKLAHREEVAPQIASLKRLQLFLTSSQAEEVLLNEFKEPEVRGAKEPEHKFRRKKFTEKSFQEKSLKESDESLDQELIKEAIRKQKEESEELFLYSVLKLDLKSLESILSINKYDQKFLSGLLTENLLDLMDEDNDYLLRSTLSKSAMAALDKIPADKKGEKNIGVLDICLLVARDTANPETQKMLHLLFKGIKNFPYNNNLLITLIRDEEYSLLTSLYENSLDKEQFIREFRIASDQYLPKGVVITDRYKEGLDNFSLKLQSTKYLRRASKKLGEVGDDYASQKELAKNVKSMAIVMLIEDSEEKLPRKIKILEKLISIGADVDRAKELGSEDTAKMIDGMMRRIDPSKMPKVRAASNVAGAGAGRS